MAHPDQSNLLPFLNRLEGHSVLSDEERLAILALPGRADQSAAHRDIVGLGKVVDHTILVVAGIVGRFDQTSNGARQITAFYIAGDMANLHSVAQPRAVSALEALSTATILRIPHAELRAIAGAYPAIAEAFWRDSIIDASILAQWVVNVGRRDARTRVAHLLCEMAVRYKVDVSQSSAIFPLPITQSQLSDATGLTPVHINRTLKGLREAGLAIVSDKAVCILDWAAMQKQGDFDPCYLQADIGAGERLRIANTRSGPSYAHPARLTGGASIANA